ncbi:MAG: hypothetical protein AW12_01346 [Candidatus Accumulibacter sp. BA-94]|nr:MAG: hypothetical protein AW12_01346 [Candidatus Accumulibacter sp. BA-94]
MAKEDYPYIHAPDPTQTFPPLRPHAEIRAQFAVSHSESLGAERAAISSERFAERELQRVSEALEHAAAERDLARAAAAAAVIRTSISAQARAGVLYLFMPPTETLDDYLELIAAVESTAEALATPIIIEGYEPPSDPRLTSFRVTPDPGVIEVNNDRGQYPAVGKLA